MLLSSALFLSACNTDDEEPDEPNKDPDADENENKDELLEITKDFVVCYDSFNSRSNQLSLSLVNKYKDDFGISLKRQSYTSSPTELEIHIGRLTSRDEYKALANTMTSLSSAGIACAVIKVVGSTLLMYGTTDDAVEVAMNRAIKLLDEKALFPRAPMKLLFSM